MTLKQTNTVLGDVKYEEWFAATTAADTNVVFLRRGILDNDHGYIAVTE